MMRRDFFIYSVLLVVGLGLAFYVSLPTKLAPSGDTVEWVKIDPKGITALTFASQGVDIELRRMPEGKGQGFWVKTTIKGENPAKGAVPVPTTIKEFKAAGRVDEVLASFNPLAALRVIGDLGDGQEFGLQQVDKDRLLKVYAGENVVLDLALGKQAYGSRNMYVYDAGKKKVLLVNGEYLSSLEKADSQLMERRLFDVLLDEVTAVEVQTPKRQKRIEHTKRDGGGNLQWHDAGEKGAVKPSYANWMSKVGNLTALNMYGPDQAQALEKGGEKFAVVKFFKGNDVSVELQLIRVSEGPKKIAYYVYSTFLGGLAKVDDARLDSIEKDLPSILE